MGCSMILSVAVGDAPTTSRWAETKKVFSTEFCDGGTRGDWNSLWWAVGGGGAGEAGGVGDPWRWREAGTEAGGGDPGPPGAEVHRAEEDAGTDGEAVQKQERRGFSTGDAADVELFLNSLLEVQSIKCLLRLRLLLMQFCVSLFCSAGIFRVEERSGWYFPAWGLHRPDGSPQLLQPCHSQLHAGDLLHARVFLPGKGQRDVQERWGRQTRQGGGLSGLPVSWVSGRFTLVQEVMLWKHKRENTLPVASPVRCVSSRGRQTDIPASLSWVERSRYWVQAELPVSFFFSDKMGIKTTVHQIVAAKQNLSLPDPVTHDDFLKCEFFTLCVLVWFDSLNTDFKGSSCRFFFFKLLLVLF